jgi:hypothetical protein
VKAALQIYSRDYDADFFKLPFAGTEVIGYFGNMFAITPDSRNLSHLTSASDFPLEPLKIYAASLCCGPVVRLDPVAPSGGGSASITYTFSADGRYIIYLADPDQDGFNELYRSDIPDFTAATAPHIAQYVINNSGPAEFRWLPLTNRARVEHRSSLGTNDTWQTIAGPITNSARWTGALPAGPSGFVRVKAMRFP